HGAGLKTRYGHLRKIFVKKGQKIKFREKIGLLGNSGRSTGAHLHYEVVYKNKLRDPMKFIRAGRYVLQQQK
ncbi:MAG: M23 family metallopeptidase, partial [Rhodospirillales bacterium]